MKAAILLPHSNDSTERTSMGGVQHLESLAGHLAPGDRNPFLEFCRSHPPLLEKLTRLVSDYAEVLQHDPNLVLGLASNLLGSYASYLLRVGGQVQHARESVRFALGFKEENPAAWSIMATILYAEGNPDAAMWAKKVLAFSPASQSFDSWDLVLRDAHEENPRVLPAVQKEMKKIVAACENAARLAACVRGAKAHAERIIKYRNDSRHCFCQIRLGNGERVLVSIGGGSAKVCKLILGGYIPLRAIWTGSKPADFAVFRAALDPSITLLDQLVNYIIDCNSSSDVEERLRMSVPVRN